MSDFLARFKNTLYHSLVYLKFLSAIFYPQYIFQSDIIERKQLM